MLCLFGHSGMFTHSVQKHCVNEGKKQEVVVSPLVMLQLTWAAGGIFMIRWAFINLFISLNISVFLAFLYLIILCSHSNQSTSHISSC